MGNMVMLTMLGECDCCGRKRELTRCWPFGIETFACDECRGIPPDDEMRQTDTGGELC